MRGSFWQKDSLITHILFELQPIVVSIVTIRLGESEFTEKVLWDYFQGFVLDIETIFFLIHICKQLLAAKEIYFKYRNMKKSIHA